MTETVPPVADPAIQAQRALLETILTAAIRAAHPDLALPPHLPAPSPGRLIILAAGKAAGSMSAVASRFYRQQHGLGDDRIVGLAVARHGYGQEAPGIHMVEAGHPVPDEAGIAATKEALRLATEAGPEDEVLVLLSGGGSANWIAPAGDLTLIEKQAITRAMLRSGAPIGEINTVRKHISRIKGGRLALAARNARRILTLAISDVPHDDPAVIASGPTVPDPSTLADARAICAKRGIPLPEEAVRLLNDPHNETPKAGDPAFARAEYRIIARPIDALKAAAEAARAAGYEPVMLGADLEGEARAVAAEHAVEAKRHKAAGRRVALISGGELTVTSGARAMAVRIRNTRWRSRWRSPGSPASRHQRRHRRNRWRPRPRHRPGGRSDRPDHPGAGQGRRPRPSRDAGAERLHRVLRGPRRPREPRPDPYQCQRLPYHSRQLGVARRRLRFSPP